MKTKLVRNIEMMQNIQSVEKNAKRLCLIAKTNIESVWGVGEEWVVNTPNIQSVFLYLNQLTDQFSIQPLLRLNSISRRIFL